MCNYAILDEPFHRPRSVQILTIIVIHDINPTLSVVFILYVKISALPKFLHYQIFIGVDGEGPMRVEKCAWVVLNEKNREMNC